MSSVLLSRWILGEAEERGITISDTEITNQLKQIAQQQFGGQKQFQQYLKQAGFSPEQARGEVERSLITDQIEKEVVPQPPTVSECRDQELLRGQQVAVLPARDARRSRDRQPRSGPGRAGQGRSWSRTTRRRTGPRSPPSTRPTRPPRTAAASVGESPRARANRPWTQQLFSAAQGALIGPIKGEKSYYLIQVDKITPATDHAAVEGRLADQAAAEPGPAAADRQRLPDRVRRQVDPAELLRHGLREDRCANFTPQDACTGDDPGESRRPRQDGVRRVRALDRAGCPRQRDRVPRPAAPRGLRRDRAGRRRRGRAGTHRDRAGRRAATAAGHGAARRALRPRRWAPPPTSP